MPTKRPRWDLDADFLRPHGCILYRAYDYCDRLLYVGISKSPVQRMSNHAANSSWWRQTFRMTFEQYDTRREAEKAELSAIRSERPAYNVAGAVPDVVIEAPAIPYESLTDEQKDRQALAEHRRLAIGDRW